MASPKRVLIVGGGMAGASAAGALLKNKQVAVTLIDTKDSFEMNLATIRSVVNENFQERLLIKHTSYLPDGAFKLGKVTNVNKSSVTLETGETIDFDFLIIATGTRYASSIFRSAAYQSTGADIVKQYKQKFNLVKNAKSVAIIGGGPVGAEVAAEIAVAYPDKTVTIIHSKSRLLDTLKPKVSEITEKFFLSKLQNVKLLLNERVIDPAESDTHTTLTTESGKTVEADLVFLCTGNGAPISSFMNENFAAKLDSKGFIKVDEYLRVEGQTNIFAIGDVTNAPGFKMAYPAGEQAKLTAKNLSLLIKKGEGAKLTKFKPLGEIMVVSLGPKFGVGQLPFGVVKGWMPTKVKSEDLMVNRTRKAFGQK